MSLRLTPFVPESPSDSDQNFALQGFQPVQQTSGQPISSLLPFVKLDTSSNLPLPFSVGGCTPQKIDPDPLSAWVIQATWHLYPLPMGDLSPTTSISPPSPLAAPQSPAPQVQATPVATPSLRQYLRSLLLFSCGAAVSTVIYANPFASLQGLLIPSVANAVPESLPHAALDPTAAKVFIETAQRQLYHLDRLAVQHNHLPPLPPVLATTPLAVPPDPIVLPASNPAPAVVSPPAIVESPPAVEPIASLAPPPLPETSQLQPLGESPLSSLAYRAPLPIPGNSGGELVGLLEQGEQSMALFKVNGTIEQVTVGGRLANGAIFAGAQEGKALLQMGNSQVPVGVGQAF